MTMMTPNARRPRIRGPLKVLPCPVCQHMMVPGRLETVTAGRSRKWTCHNTLCPIVEVRTVWRSAGTIPIHPHIRP